MQKKLIALAVAGMMSGAVFAQSNVQIYGIIDVGYANVSSGQTTNSKSLIQSGMLSDSRIGFKGTEDLGGGLKANFVLEHGLDADVGNATTIGATGAPGFWARTATVGLSGSFGAINLGRQYTPIFNVLAASDVSINSAIVSDFGQTGATARSSNSVKYTSPDFSGFTAQAIWGAGATDTGLTKNDDETGYSLAYAGGPLSVGVAQHFTKGVGVKNKETAFGVSYDFKVVKLFAMYVKDKDTDNNPDTRTWQVQGAFGVGPGTAVVSYFDRKDKTAANMDSRGIGLAYLYPMSKRTTVYAAWGKRSNEDGATTALNKGVPAATAGYDPKLFGIGVRHTF